jgi:hypothetical protein
MTTFPPFVGDSPAGRFCYAVMAPLGPSSGNSMPGGTA